MLKNSRSRIRNILVLIVFIIILYKFNNTKPTRVKIPYVINNNLSVIQFDDKIPNNNKTIEYFKKCCDLYFKLRNPDKKLQHKIPPVKPPKELFEEFTRNGSFAYGEFKYYGNDSYSDSAKPNGYQYVFKDDDLYKWLDKIENNEPLGYEDLSMKETMFKYESLIKEKSMAVIGTLEIWIEAIVYKLGSSEIVTLDYTNKAYALPRLKWLHVNDYYDLALKHKKFENFDNAASFSSIEHSGLGRFGDPLSPNGDLEAMQQIHCMLKPGGLLFLEIQLTDHQYGIIEFNAHRVYGVENLK